jgi:type I restriction enzyme S subunit
MGFIKQVLSNKYFVNYLEVSFTGSVIKNVSLKSMREFPIVVPPFIEQSKFNDIVDPIVLMQDELHTENQTLTTLRDTLLPKLISGAIRVKDATKMLAASL